MIFVLLRICQPSLMTVIRASRVEVGYTQGPLRQTTEEAINTIKSAQMDKSTSARSQAIVLSGTRLEKLSVLELLSSDTILIDIRYVRIIAEYEIGNFSNRSDFGAEKVDDLIEKDTIVFGLRTDKPSDISIIESDLAELNISIERDKHGSILIRESQPKIRVISLSRSQNGDFYEFHINNIKRIIPRFKTILATTANAVFRVPKDCSRFAWLMLRSKFISCDHDSALRFRNKYPIIFKRKPRIDPSIIAGMTKLRDWAIDHGATPMLSSGTLLGWMRECGIIYHTHDIDFAFFSNEYYDGMIEDIQKTDFMRMRLRLNLPEDLLEFTVVISATPVDIFFIYNNRTISWIGGLSGKQRYRFIYPFISEVCATTLLDHLMYVPCNALDVIKADYGKEWTELKHTSEYMWNISPHSVHKAGEYTDEEYVNARQLF